MASSSTNIEKSRLDLLDLQRLIKMIEKSPITEFELVEKDLRIRISKNGHSNGAVQVVSAQPAMQIAAATMPAIMKNEDALGQSSLPSKQSIIEVKCPMVGTFYRSPAPDADVYVKVGDNIEPGKVICIVEAMKIMNEIEAEIKGKIIEIMVENAHPVEFGQVLFKVDTHGA